MSDQKNLLRIMKEVARTLEMDVNDVHDVVQWMWKSSKDALKTSKSIEISNFGNFKIRKKHTEKRLAYMESIEDKTPETEENIKYLKTKI
jgi:nucleoid DNA-binding protein